MKHFLFIVSVISTLLLTNGCQVFKGKNWQFVKKVTIKDQLDVNWKNELVHYKLTFEKGQFRYGAKATVIHKEKEIPCQVTDVKYYGDGSTNSYKVWFFANVPKNGSSTYTIIPGEKAISDDWGVRVFENDKMYQFTTDTKDGVVGIELLKGNIYYNWPVSSKKVPGPITNLVLPSGKTVGKGKLNLPFKVKAYRTELLSRGPLFADLKTYYLFDKGYWVFRTRLIKGCQMVVINEEFNTGQSPKGWDKFDNFYTFDLTEGSFKPTEAFFTENAWNPHPDKEFYNLMYQGYDEEMFGKSGYSLMHFACKVNGFKMTYKKNRLDFGLSPYPGYSLRRDCFIRFIQPGKDAIAFAALDPTKWRHPMSIRFYETTKKQVIVKFPLQRYAQHWAMDNVDEKSPHYTGKTLFVGGDSCRRNYGIMLSKAGDEMEYKLKTLIQTAVKLSSQPLDVIKDWQLDWADPMANAKWAKESSEKGKEALNRLNDWIEFNRHFGNYSAGGLEKHAMIAKKIVPELEKVINSEKDLSWQDRQALRRKLAYLAHFINSRKAFPWGSGVHLGAPNMALTAMRARALTSSLVKDHPKFKPWGKWTVEFLKNYLKRYVRESGAPFECPHYTLGPSLKDFAATNEICNKFGLGDSFNTPLLRKEMKFMQQWLTPPDPRFNNHRVVAPFGNTSYQSIPPESIQPYIQYYKKKDPKLAAEIQWFANQTLPKQKKLKVMKNETKPSLKSGAHKDYGVTFRHGFGTPYETYFHMLAGNCTGHYEWETDQMAYTLYAKGQPINLHFGNGYFPMFCRPWLRNRLTLSGFNFEKTEMNEAAVEDTVLSKDVDYVKASKGISMYRKLATEYPDLDKNGRWSKKEMENWRSKEAKTYKKIPLMTWYRQVMFMKDPNPKGPNYFVFRETLEGKPVKPTDLSFWFLANFMKKEGDVYHFDGQCNVNMDLFVVSPENEEPQTGKYGHTAHPYKRLTGENLNFFPNKKRREDQLLFRLSQPAGKGYMVVLYPRLKKNDPAAKFTRLAKNAVKVETSYSTDYIFMDSYRFELNVDKVKFSGSSCAVRFMKDKSIKIINTEGDLELSVAGKTIKGDGPFEVTIKNGKVTKKKL